MKTPCFDPFPMLETERLSLRALMPEDAPAMHRLRSNREVMRWLDRPLTGSIGEAGQLIEKAFESRRQGTAVMWAMALKNEPVMIGCICFVRIEAEHSRTEVGYLLDPAFHRQGLMGEALSRVVEYGFDDLQFHKIMASTSDRNTASVRLLEKNGFVRESFHRQHYSWNGRYIDTIELARYSPAALAEMKNRENHPLQDFHE